MKQELKNYSLTCDGCGQTFEWGDGLVCFADDEDGKLIEETARNSYWKVMNGHHYCPDCWERECQTMIEAAQAEARAAKEDFEARKAALQEQMDTTLAMRRMELDQEYELKKMQLELDTPKRFAQGEWVSGKTLKEIIEVLARGEKKN